MKRKEFLIIPVFLSLLAVLATPLYAEKTDTASTQSEKTTNEDDSKKIVATVNNSPITLKQVRMRAQLASREVAYHTQISDEKKQEIMAKALDQLIVEELAYQEAK